MLSFIISNGILNCEWAVRPLFNKIDAIPEDATAKVILPAERTHARIKFSINVFPVPPGPSIKKMPPLSV